MAIFKGAGVAIVTPFSKDGSVNWYQLKKNIDFQIEHKTDAIIVCGTTGEASTMTHEEQIEVIRFCSTVVAGRVPVIAGTGSNCTREAVDLSKRAQSAGADALLVVTPYYNKATQKGLIDHYLQIDKSVNIPIILYNIPGRTGGVNILPETVLFLAEKSANICAIKDATGNISQVAKMMALVGNKIHLYSGNDDQVVPILSLGGSGVISVLSNVAPEYVHNMCNYYFEGDVETSRELQLKAIPFINALFSEVNPIPVKAAMNLQGQKAGTLRMPLTPMEKANEEKLKQCMIEFFNYCSDRKDITGFNPKYFL